jgi:hypothetical protein
VCGFCTCVMKENLLPDFIVWSDEAMENAEPKDCSY